MDKKNFLAKAIARAWKDPEFKKKLLNDPKSAFKEMGIEIPKDITVKVVEDTPKSVTVVIPSPPTQINELNETEIQKIAAAGICTLFSPMGTQC